MAFVLTEAQSTRSLPCSKFLRSRGNMQKRSMHVLLILKKHMIAFLENKLGAVLLQYGIDGQLLTAIKSTTKMQRPSWLTGWEVMTTSSCWVRGYNSTPSPTVQSTPVNRTVERDSAVSGY